MYICGSISLSWLPFDAPRRAYLNRTQDWIS
ncbi:protein of unknown function [Rhodovastum atsumiense]|nr:protein of unknown function [Rhodovastum atsumiense]